MRPNIDISHRKNGRARDLADHFELTTQEIYERIIDRGINELESEAFEGFDVDWEGIAKECEFDEAELAAAKAVVAHVRGRGGTMLKADILEEVKPDHEARKGNDDNWWRKIVNPLVDADLLEKFHEGGVRVPAEE